MILYLIFVIIIILILVIWYMYISYDEYLTGKNYIEYNGKIYEMEIGDVHRLDSVSHKGVKYTYFISDESTMFVVVFKVKRTDPFTGNKKEFPNNRYISILTHKDVPTEVNLENFGVSPNPFRVSLNTFGVSFQPEYFVSIPANSKLTSYAAAIGYTPTYDEDEIYEYFSEFKGGNKLVVH